MRIIKDILEKSKEKIKEREESKKKKEEEYRIKVKQDAREAKKEIKALQELEKDKATIEELQKLRTKLNPKPKWSEAITKFMEGSGKSLDEIDKVNKKFDSPDYDEMLKPNLENLFIGEPVKTKKKDRLFNI